jgi:predicted RNA-binding protein YlqC (UPF0109 family)
VSDVDRDDEHTLEDDLAEDDEYDDYEDDGDDVDDDDDVVDGNRIPAATASAVLEYLARSIVEDPDSVVVDVKEQGRGVSLEVRVAPGDMGRVIGKRGRVANAIRTVVRAAAAHDGIEADVEFED